MESLSILKSGHSGTIPDSIGCLSFLRTLEIFGNRISGPIPFSIRLFVGNLFQLWAQFILDNEAGGTECTPERSLMKFSEFTHSPNGIHQSDGFSFVL
ncbi:putative leucine-rich repeat protein [Tanacetum coccineum]